MNRPSGWTTVSVTSNEKNTPDAKFWVRAVPADAPKVDDRDLEPTGR